MFLQLHPISTYIIPINEHDRDSIVYNLVCIVERQCRIMIDLFNFWKILLLHLFFAVTSSRLRGARLPLLEFLPKL
uniref:Uncharacterized protein n=1 Tax=Rhizophora mucronata TaxID=61149 RepID=A0A2P2JSD8_RHIMU